MQSVAINWHVYLLTKSPFALGLVGLFRGVPIILCSLAGGVVADAVDRKRLMIVTQLVMLASAALLTAGTLFGLESVWPIYILSAFASAASAFEVPARQSLLPTLVPVEDFPNAVSLGIVVFNVATITGPAIAGFLLAESGPAVIYGLNALSFLAVIASLVLMKASGKPDLQGYWRGQLAQSFSVEGVSGNEPLVGSSVMPWEISPPMIVDPPDRKIPYQAWAVPIGRIGVNYHQYVDPRTACGSGGVPRLALQDASQILQPDGDQFLVWLHEDHHVQRVIAMNGRPPLGNDIKVTNGDSRGRWDGNTLVIDSANFNGYNWFDDSGNFYTDTVHIVERLTMIDRDTIHYEVRVEDPKVYTRPWTLVWALVREKEPGFELLEEACREGQRDLDTLLQSGMKYYFDKPWQGR